MSRRPLLALACLALLAAGCGSPGSDAHGPLTVLAAASLTGPFTTLGRQFEAAHPGVAIRFGFASSSSLAAQITQGAPADVFAAASPQTMQQVLDAGAASRPLGFATNRMQIAVPPQNPGRIRRLADLARPGTTVALCQPAVPCGSLARQVLASAHLRLTPVTEESDVKAALTKVQLGEVDAAIVYVTDVQAAGAQVRGIQIPADVNATTSYPIATLTATRSPEAARAFVDYVRSPQGAQVLAAAGFGPP